METPDCEAALVALRNAFAGSLPAHPLAAERIEAAADFGLHFTLLSAEAQGLARGDFFHTAFLRDWIQNIIECRLVNASTALGEKLLALSAK